MAKCKSSVSSLWTSTELIVKFRAKNPSVYTVYKHHLTLTPVVFWRDFSWYLFTFSLFSFPASLSWFSPFYGPRILIPGVKWGWELDGSCINHCDRVIACLSWQMPFLIFTNKQTHLNRVWFAFPVSWSRCRLSSESCLRDTWDVHVHRIKDSFCCLRNPPKSHLRIPQI